LIYTHHTPTASVPLGDPIAGDHLSVGGPMVGAGDRERDRRGGRSPPAHGRCWWRDDVDHRLDRRTHASLGLVAVGLIGP